MCLSAQKLPKAVNWELQFKWHKSAPTFPAENKISFWFMSLGESLFADLLHIRFIPLIQVIAKMKESLFLLLKMFIHCTVIKTLAYNF